MGNNQTKNRRRGPSVTERAQPAVHPLYPNLTNEFSTYGHANTVDFRGTPTPEACFSNPIPNFHYMQGPGSSTSGPHTVYPDLANQYSTYAQPNTPISDAYFGHMMPNFYNLQSNCNPAPSAPPAPPEGELMRAEITAIVQSVLKQEVEMQTKQSEEPKQDQKIQKSQTRNKRNNKNTLNNHPEKKTCPNADDGCKLYLKPEAMQLHVKECLFKNYSCPLNGIFGLCVWLGKVKDIRDHFEANHPTNIGHVAKVMFLDCPRIIHLVELGPHKFLVHIKVDEMKRNIFVGVQLYSTQICASRWTYEFEFHGPMMPNIKLQNTCIPVGVAINKFDKPQCGMLNMTPCIWNAFKNGALRFQYRIMTVKVVEGSKGKT